MKLHIALLMSALGATNMAGAQAAEYEEYGRVTRVEPRVEQIRQPREECRTEYVQVAPQQVPQQRSAGGAILGAVAGGILGNQVGGGSGKAAATAIGAVAGAVAGDRISNGSPNSQPQYDSRYPQEQAVRRCRMVDAYESRTVGYDVTYNYGGRSYTSMMPRDPGDRVRLRVSVEPDPRQ
jgi:uncharacterized protein YcfJ